MFFPPPEFFLFFLNDPATTEISPLPHPDPLPISVDSRATNRCETLLRAGTARRVRWLAPPAESTRRRVPPQSQPRLPHPRRGGRRPSSRRSQIGRAHV